VNIQHIGDDLSSGGFVSLPLRTGTDGNDNFSINIKLAIRALRVAGERGIGIDDLRLAEIVGAGVERGADADADPAPTLPCVFLSTHHPIRFLATSSIFG
jgi:hypothetical protein